jgi:hypothetical protein
MEGTMYLTSSKWNEELGVCTLHGLPQVPCPQCSAEMDENVCLVIEEIDRVVLDMSPQVSLPMLAPDGAPVKLVKEKTRGAGTRGVFRSSCGVCKEDDGSRTPAWAVELAKQPGVVEHCREEEFRFVTQ